MRKFQVSSFRKNYLSLLDLMVFDLDIVDGVVAGVEDITGC
jgi:hypothetical protein